MTRDFNELIELYYQTPRLTYNQISAKIGYNAKNQIIYLLRVGRIQSRNQKDRVLVNRQLERRNQYLKLRSEGMTWNEIARLDGISRQAVHSFVVKNIPEYIEQEKQKRIGYLGTVLIKDFVRLYYQIPQLNFLQIATQLDVTYGAIWNTRNELIKQGLITPRKDAPNAKQLMLARETKKLRQSGSTWAECTNELGTRRQTLERLLKRYGHFVK